MDAVRALLPGPTLAAICQVAGLLTGPDASEDEAKIASILKHLAQIMRHTTQILHHCNSAVADKAAQRTETLAALPPDKQPGVLAAMLRAGFAETEQRRTERRQQQRDEEAAKKREIQDMLDRHQRDNDSGQAAA